MRASGQAARPPAGCQLRIGSACLRVRAALCAQGLPPAAQVLVDGSMQLRVDLDEMGQVWMNVDRQQKSISGALQNERRLVAVRWAALWRKSIRHPRKASTDDISQFLVEVALCKTKKWLVAVRWAMLL